MVVKEQAQKKGGSIISKQRSPRLRRSLSPLLLSFLLAAGGLLFFALGIRDVVGSLALARSAEQTQGVVIRTWKTHLGDTSDRFHVSYSYRAGGRSYESSSQISEEERKALETGGPVAVYFDPAGPQNSRALRPFDFWNDLLPDLSGCALALLFAAGGTCSLCAVLRRRDPRKQEGSEP